MGGEPALDLHLERLPTSALVTDIVYTPLHTPLLTAAASRGNPIVDGLGMLLHQARPGFEAWFGQVPEVTPELRRFVLESL
jgi:shikimate dehydrogenase